MSQAAAVGSLEGGRTGAWGRVQGASPGGAATAHCSPAYRAMGTLRVEEKGNPLEREVRANVPKEGHAGFFISKGVL